jgi:hypothetical protein
MRMSPACPSSPDGYAEIVEFALLQVVGGDEKKAKPRTKTTMQNRMNLTFTPVKIVSGFQQ